jgi:hypothetical protein
MKITNNCSRSESWGKLTTEQRFCILRTLGLSDEAIIGGNSAMQLAGVAIFEYLPIPVKVLLSFAFENGRFSGAASNRKLKELDDFACSKGTRLHGK